MTSPGLTAYQLRAVRPTDAPAVADAFASADDMSRQGPVADEASAGTYLEWLSEPGRRGYAVTRDDLLVGLIGVTVDEANRSGWVFYWLHAAHRGRGLMQRAVATVCDQLLDEGLERLELGHRVNNPASGAVARAAGFVQEGRERGKFLVDGERVDVLTYGRLASDPWPTIEHLPQAGRR